MSLTPIKPRHNKDIKLSVEDSKEMSVLIKTTNLNHLQDKILT